MNSKKIDRIIELVKENNSRNNVEIIFNSYIKGFDKQEYELLKEVLGDE